MRRRPDILASEALFRADSAAIGVATAQMHPSIQAFAQVADALSAIEHDGEMVAASRRAVDIAGASLKLQRSSYTSGRTSALQLIVAENTYSNARLGYVRAVGQRLTDTAALFVAVVGGGGWWIDGGMPPELPGSRQPRE